MTAPTLNDGRISSATFLEHTGLTWRQVCHWSANGVFGPEHVDVGSGRRRRFPTELVEAGLAAADLSRFTAVTSGTKTATMDVLTRVVDTVARRPVVDGEVLVIDMYGAIERHAGIDDAWLTDGPMVVIPLRTYTPGERAR